MSKINEPIAIVGMGCRFPGSSSSPQKFWEKLLNKTDAIVDVPLDRWDNRRFYHDEDGKPGKTRCKQGGFLAEDIREFDSLFFGISPLQGECLDPQSRLLLEVTYEAFEDSGLTLEELRGSKTGVFIGCFTFDNSVLQIAHGNDKIMDSNTSTGLSYTILSNRISYAFDLKGPSLSIDTACSSSMVALHYACRSLWDNETTACVVGGVNLILLPYNSVSMSKGMFLSKDGRCKAFDDRANGYVRSEGAGVMVIKPLRKALEDKDRIYSVILGTGVNQDGQTNGMTVPNKEAQKALIQKIYAENNIDIKKVHYFEAHGTGTPVGDPLEFSAINEVLAESGEVTDKRLVGSVKTNIGHLEAGAGIAGLIKTALCLHHNAVPPNLHFENPNPALNYEESLLKVPTSLEELPKDQTSLASINSFGYGGTNAHAVLQQFKTEKNGRTPNDKLRKYPFIFPISAKSKGALKQLAGNYKKFIEQNEDKFDQVLSNAIYRRTHFPNRVAVTAASQYELIERLEAFEEDILVSGVVEGRKAKKESKVVFVYTGMGPQWWKMGRELMETEPVFYDAIKECDQHFKKIAGWSILEEMQRPEEHSRIKETNIAQPANFVIQMALTRLLKHYGILPEAVVGHSVGEVASAYASGALTLEEALTVSFHRSRLQKTTAGKGTMVAVGMSETESSKLINGYTDVSIAAINSPNAITLAGGDGSIKKIADKCEKLGVFNRVLEVEVPYHSPVMSLIKDELLDVCESIQGQATTTDLYSTVTGEIIEGSEINNAYWWRNVREPVRFAKTVDTLINDGYNIFIEIGPHPVLKNSIVECVGDQDKIQLVQTLNRKKDEVAQFYENLAKCYTLGFPLKWENWIDKLPHLPLPTYPWQKENLWRETQASWELRSGRGGNVFLNRLIDAPQPTYQVELNKYYFPFLVDHTIQDRKVFPGAAYITAGIALSQFVIKNNLPASIENIVFHQMLTVDESKVQNLYTSYDPKNYGYSIFSKFDQDNAAWVKRATGKIVVGQQNARNKKLDIDNLIGQMKKVVTQEEVYERLCNGMLHLGPFFQTVKKIHVDGPELVGIVKAHPGMRVHESDHDYLIHPTLLDGCFQTLTGFDTGYDQTDFVPVSIDKVHLYAPPTDELYCYVKLNFADSNSANADLFICNPDGSVAIEIEGFRCQGIVPDKIQETNALADKFVYPEWIAAENADAQPTGAESVYYLLTQDYATAAPFLEGFSGKSVVLELGPVSEKVAEDHYRINLEDIESVKDIIDTDQPVNLISLLSLSKANHFKVSTSDICVDHINPFMDIVRFIYKNSSQDFNLNILTQGSQKVATDEKLPQMELSVIHGLGRIIVNEMPNCKVRLLDLERAENRESTADILNILVQRVNQESGRFEELALRGGTLYLRKFANRENTGATAVTEEVHFQKDNLQLFASKRAGIEGLKFISCERVAPREDQIEILIDQATISPKDYLKVTGNIDQKTLEGTYTTANVGMDCSGTVTWVGPAVTDFRVGDNVQALVPGAIQTYTNTDAALAIRRPDNWKHSEAYPLSSYLTALFGLKERANLQKGDKVLIHNATGIVGLAAINYAQLVGAEIVATTDSEKGREYLASIGIEQVYNTGDLSFAKEILDQTDGKGVNVVLSDLPGEMVYQNFSVLAPYGVYLEIGKNDNALLPAKFFSKNLSYTAIDMDKMIKDYPEKVGILLRELYDYFDTGKLRPLPSQTFTPGEISEAFQSVNNSEHIGAVTVNFKDQTVQVERENIIVKPDTSYLITGGTRGLGMEIGKWLVDNGAQHIALLSRSGLKEDYARKTVTALRERGIQVEVFSADIGDAKQMEAVFLEMNQRMPELAGVFHCAMVLDDAYLLDLDESRFRKVFGPKIDGAVNLFHFTKNLELDYFVLFSSISSLIGNVGQGNYVAANAFLDSFAHYSREHGMNAIAINLGVMKDSGVVSRNEKLAKMLANIGTLGLTNDMFFEGLKQILQEKPTQIGFFNLDWETFSQNTGDSSKFLFGNMFANGANGNSFTEEQEQHLEKIETLGASEGQKFIAEELTKEISSILKIRKEKVDRETGVNFLGVDSILAAELIIKVKKKFIVEILPIEFLSGPSINELSKMILERLQKLYVAAEWSGA